MPPYAKDRVIWQYPTREVVRQHVDPLNGKSWRVVVLFHRVGMRADTQQRVTETVSTCVVAERLGPNQAQDLVASVADACRQSYAQGFDAGKGSGTR